jgi:hypothetical protein
MSHLNTPRVHFRGTVSVNAYTTNNDDFANPQFVDTANIRVDTQGMTDAQFAAWLRALDPSFGIRAGWNLYGDGTTLFSNTNVHALQDASGAVVTDGGTDALVGASVELRLAVMVDLDPKGALSSQIFCEEFHVQGPGGVLISGKPTRSYSRWVLQRNLGASGFTGYAGVWHAVIPAASLTLTGAGSATITLFQQAKTAGQGLFLRYVMYLLSPQISAQQLANDFAHNTPTENPAIGRVLGSIGVYNPGEMTTIPVGRRLDPGATLVLGHMNYQLNPATFSVDQASHRLSLDLINSVPEVDTGLAKVSLGNVNAYVETQGGGGTQLQLLGAVAYDRAAYEQTGGMVDISYPPALDDAVQSGQVVLIQESSQSRLLEETELTVETDDRCVYLDANQAGSLTLRVLRKGGPPGAPVTIRLMQYITTQKSFTPSTPTTAVVTIPDQVSTDANGMATIPLTTANPGTCVITFLLPGVADDDTSAFANVRVLPVDDYSNVTDAQLTFSLIYAEVLKYYWLLYPKMNRIIDLSQEIRVTLRAQFIRDRTDPARFEHTDYMPRTRELSNGKRQLLLRWCNKVISGG